MDWVNAKKYDGVVGASEGLVKLGDIWLFIVYMLKGKVFDPTLILN